MRAKLGVDLKKTVDDSYDIQIGSGVFKDLSSSGAIYVIDRNVYELHRSNMPSENVFLFDASETNKTLESATHILTFLKEKKCMRSSVLTAIGGGITGDITAFAASVYMRGIKCRQVPTTLLSMVDSSVGGKCGVNFSGTKNFVGTFWQPQSVTIDMDFLKTLAEDDFYSGFAEVIKMALTFDAEFVEYLKDNQKKIHDRDTDTLGYIVKKCCEIKADVVMQDERESGLRRLLNFGHTFGHAIETDSHHGIKHGQAVAIGMALETEYAATAGLIEQQVDIDVKAVLRQFGYDTHYAIKSMDVFINALSEDKKALNSGLVLSLTDDIGSGKIIEGVQIEHLSSFFQQSG